MCGIAGLWSDKLSQEQLRDRLNQMSQRIAHRGPDSHGIFVDSTQPGIGFAHRRLAILDLSEAGHQPMTSPSGRYTIVLNGEIYNFKELAAELGAHGFKFRGGSDTEVVLAAIEQWGVESALHKFLGMFAFGVFDRQTQKLYLARDRFGVKPLYYAQYAGGIAFASEIGAFETLPDFDQTLNPNAVDALRLHLCIPGSLSIYKNVHKLRPGHILIKSRTTLSSPSIPASYWDPITSAQNAAQQGQKLHYEEAKAELHSLLISSVKYRMISDVPIGCFLSGGVDSSLVAAIMQSQSSSPIRTFTIGFQEREFNEAPFAEAVARHLGTRHETTVLTAADALAIIPKMGSIYDEPFADSSQIATYLVAREARKHVTVSLSGDGGDEFFAGYNRYVFSQIWGSTLAQTPQLARHLVANLLSGRGPNRIANLANMAGYHRQNLRDKLGKLGRIARTDSNFELYRALTNIPTSNNVNDEECLQLIHRAFDSRNGHDDVTSMQLADVLWYLPDDILVKVDRATMAVGLEAREPLLDHRLFEFANQLPTSAKISRDRGGKRILKDILSLYVPDKLFHRPKAGFSLPIAAWLRGGLCDWADDLLNSESMTSVGISDSDAILRLWSQHKRGEIDAQDSLWPVLSLLSWKRQRSCITNS